MMKRPSFQFYPGDWLRDTALRSCSIAARGLWIDLMCFMHDGSPYGHLAVGKDTSKVIPEVQLAQMVGLHLPQFRTLLRELERADVLGRTPTGVIYSRRMVRDEQLRQVRAAGGVLALEHPNHPSRKERGKVDHQGADEGRGQGSGEGRDSGGTPAVAVASARHPVGSPRETWLTPYFAAWVAMYGGKPAAGPLVKALKPLHDEHGSEKTLAHWRTYLGKTEARFASPAKFAQTFGTWTNGNGSRDAAFLKPSEVL